MTSSHHLVLVNPRSRVTVPRSDSLRKPQSNLTFSVLDGVRAMADVSSNINGEVTADSSRSRVGWLGSTQHHTASLDSTLSLPHHAAHRTGEHVLNQSSKESLGGQISVVSLEQLTLRLEKLQSLQFESLKSTQIVIFVTTSSYL